MAHMTSRPLVPEIEEIFIEERRPLHYVELTQMLIDRGVWDTTPPTPERTVVARLSTETKKNSTTPVFVRVGSGTYRYNRRFPKKS